MIARCPTALAKINACVCHAFAAGDGECRADLSALGRDLQSVLLELSAETEQDISLLPDF